MRPAYGETVTLLRTESGGVDEYGNDIITSTESPVPDCAVWPDGGTRTGENGEIDGDRTTVIIGLTVLVPPGYAVRATDRVRVRGAIYEVQGEPGYWRSYLTGHEAGTEVALRRVEG